ncbi:MAG: DNA cytosine methyltransferase [Candidatus Gracilibacteria bacterium]|nr:DNA cytosine methyltransferase [Candidatus Gracilibacteria bacterium]MDD4530511.1 DNA cytosine methyltransferase [Candidatus Gracilibacteria bacterium]
MKIISLFCGCGGLDLGFHMAGHEIVYANDFDKDSIETYKKNFDTSNCVIEHKSIIDVNINNIPDGDIVIGGFPCQGFSVANIYRNEEDDRNKLYLELLRVIKGKNPKFFLAENVTGLCSLGGYKNDFDKSKKLGKIFKMILNDFRKIGYDVEWKILNSSDYGVPQNRKRVIIVGIRNDLKYKYIFPKIKFINKKTVRDAIGDLPIEYSQNIPNHHGSKYKVKINGYLGNRHIEWDKPAPTITGRGGGTGGPIIMPHPSQERRMTVREYARIQTFPDNFIFEGSISSQYRQIGNAVPPLMGIEIGKQFNKLEVKKEKEIITDSFQISLFNLRGKELVLTN